MADEVTIRSSLQILKTKLAYSSKPTAFNGDIVTADPKGPTPGAVEVSVAGTSIDLTELTTPAYCRLMNLDDTNFVEFGIWDPEGSTFYPLGELLAGESYVIRLSRNIQQEYGTGTGTTGADTNRLRLKADTAPCNVLVEAFEA